MENFIYPEGNDDADIAENGLEAILVTDFPDLILSQPEMIRLFSHRFLRCFPY